MIHGMSQHICHVVEFAFAIARRIIDAIIDDPEAVEVRIDIHTRNHADAFDHAMGIAAILPAHKVNRIGIAFIHHCIIEDEIALRRLDDLVTDILPDQAWRNAVISQVTVEGIVTALLGVISEIGQGIVDLATEQILAIVEPADRRI